MEVKNQNYRQKYIKFLKRQNLSNINTGRYIAKFPRGGGFRSKLQTEIFQNSQKVEFIKQDYRQKHHIIPNIHGCFLTKNILRNMNQVRMSQGRTGKRSAYMGGTETIVWNRY